jgi:hypothetical protein
MCARRIVGSFRKADKGTLRHCQNASRRTSLENLSTIHEYLQRSGGTVASNSEVSIKLQVASRGLAWNDRMLSSHSRLTASPA